MAAKSKKAKTQAETPTVVLLLAEAVDCVSNGDNQKALSLLQQVATIKAQQAEAQK